MSESTRGLPRSLRDQHTFRQTVVSSADGLAVAACRAFAEAEGADDATRTAGALQFVETAAAGVIVADDLINLVYKLRAGYRANGTFVMNSTTAAVVHKLKDAEGRFMWADSLAAGQPARLLGYPVVIAEDMPSIAVGAFPIAFGDFRAGYTIADRTGVRLIRDEVTRKGYTGFYLSKRVGGIVTDDAAIKLMKIKAA